MEESEKVSERGIQYTCLSYTSMVRATASIFKKSFAFNSGNKTTDLKAEGTSMTNC